MLISTLQKAVENEQTQKMLPPEMQNALKKANNLFLQQKQTGFLVDTIFKKAQYEHMMRLSRADKALHSYFLSFVDLKNIELCFRFRDKNIFESTRLLGGTLENNFFEMLCEKPLETILLKTANSPYFSAIKLLANAFENGKPFSQFEFLVDCFGVTFFDEFKFNTNKNYAYLRYCFLKQNELTNLRIIFEGLQAKRSHKKICEDLRRVYAK